MSAASARRAVSYCTVTWSVRSLSVAWMYRSSASPGSARWVIGDRATGHASIDAHIYRGSEETERDDGAKAMRAALKRSAGGPRLHYFSLPNGTIEFVQIGYHDMSLG
jgi:hypothetical protein